MYHRKVETKMDIIIGFCLCIVACLIIKNIL
nr:MAG TPA: hypothetical protein [Caudoviricetes sp.]